MTLQIELSPEIEARLREQAAAVGKDPAAFAREAVEEKLAASARPAADSSKLSNKQRAAKWLAWVDSHRPVGHFVDDSRESIYEGRGE
ncbi:MAG TPA: hypothetical protein PKG54_00365 [Phycisphaerae bacterium]|jgi:predicted transcriptional regulator|nr:hypothetical protein [Phycisphaerae bacterium]HOB72952.1 hypothetical protein [Phycisphaerae bacterium]HOJ52999.1 hypothetical protein [Phycisphaerae bacterium]HOL24736.1 hypothetical protein [Phycisphaerae bacterium]HPP19272.1 hypothetical protein [Phycisphaerae bacterium]